MQRMCLRKMFESTRWSLVSRVKEGAQNVQTAQRALEELCQIYWTPLYAFVRRSGYEPAAAEDLVQGFFLAAMEKGLFAAADAEKGRMRNFLITALKRFLVNEDEKARAQKRGGKVGWVWIDAEAGEVAIAAELVDDSLTPDAAYDRRWACALLDRVLQRLREEHAERGKEPLFETLAPMLSRIDPELMEKAVKELCSEPNAVRVALHRFRKRYRELVREEVAETLQPGEDVDEEVRALMGLF